MGNSRVCKRYLFRGVDAGNEPYSFEAHSLRPKKEPTRLQPIWFF